MEIREQIAELADNVQQVQAATVLRLAAIVRPRLNALLQQERESVRCKQNASGLLRQSVSVQHLPHQPEKPIHLHPEVLAEKAAEEVAAMAVAEAVVAVQVVHLEEGTKHEIHIYYPGNCGFSN